MAADLPPPVLRHAPGELPGDAAGAEPLHRIADQLHALSRVAETLTVRLLELEERLVNQEGRLQPLIEAAASADSAGREAMDLRLLETEERLARLESLLQQAHDEGSAGWAQDAGGRRPLRAVAAGYGPKALDPHGLDPEGFEEELDPFPEEGEQPFMDERIA